MKIRQLEYFLDVARLLSFTKAADKNYISQSAITQQIKALEEELNVTLFNRSKKHLTLTSAGVVFINEAESIIDRMDSAREKVKMAELGESGALEIGFLNGCELSSFPKYIQSYCESHPNINISLLRSHAIDLYNNIQLDKLDIAFLIDYNSSLHSELDSLDLMTYPLFAIMSPRHPFAYHTSLQRSELHSESMLMINSNETLDESVTKIYQQYLNSGFVPNVIKEVDNAEIVQIMASAGLGVAVLPEFAIHRWNSSLNLVEVPLEGNDEFVTMTAVWKKANQNPALIGFLEMLRQ